MGFSFDDAVMKPAKMRFRLETESEVLGAALALGALRCPDVSPAEMAAIRGVGAAAVLASAALMAARSVGTARRREGKGAQELMVVSALGGAGIKRVDTSAVTTLNLAPNAGESCRECVLGSRKADIVVRLWGHRIMPIDCKASNSALNSIKRLNNDAG